MRRLMALLVLASVLAATVGCGGSPTYYTAPSGGPSTKPMTPPPPPPPPP